MILGRGAGVCLVGARCACRLGHECFGPTAGRGMVRWWRTVWRFDIRETEGFELGLSLF